MRSILQREAQRRSPIFDRNRSVLGVKTDSCYPDAFISIMELFFAIFFAPGEARSNWRKQCPIIKCRSIKFEWPRCKKYRVHNLTANSPKCRYIHLTHVFYMPIVKVWQLFKLLVLRVYSTWYKYKMGVACRRGHCWTMGTIPPSLEFHESKQLSDK